MPVGTVQLINMAEYARRRGCTEGAVRRAVRDGRISLIEGKLDPVAADAQWARNTRVRAGSRATDDMSIRVLQGRGVGGSTPRAPSAGDARPAPRCRACAPCPTAVRWDRLHSWFLFSTLSVPSWWGRAVPTPPGPVASAFSRGAWLVVRRKRLALNCTAHLREPVKGMVPTKPLWVA